MQNAECRIQKNMENKNIVAAAVIAAGMALMGWFMYEGIHQLAQRNDTVTVKGLSTQDVQADYVVWPLNYSLQGNDLKLLYAQLSQTTEQVRAFLISKGFEEADLRQGTTNVNDQWASYYDRRPDYHYSLSTSIVVSTAKVERVLATQSAQAELLSQGVILNSYEWSTNYQFNGLNEIKPQMIEEATQNARAVAQKFADDSHSRLGRIRHANQGQFSVETDQFQPWVKHVRVVTTIDFALK